MSRSRSSKSLELTQKDALNLKPDVLSILVGITQALALFTFIGELSLIDLKEARCLADAGRVAEARGKLEGCRARFSDMQMYWHAAEAQRLEDRLQSE